MILRGSSECDTEIWNEAVATALMAQHRPEDAGKYYELASKNGKSLSEQTNLTAARWSWPFTAISLPVVTDNTTEGILGRACIGAALGGNVSLLAQLQKCGVTFDFAVSGCSPASAAARVGQIEVLKLLHSYGANLRIAPRGGDCPLSEAAQYGCYEAAKFLLNAGCRPDLSDSHHIISSPVDHAAFYGKIEILRLFVEHCPELRTARASNGTLRIRRAIEGKQINVINFFIDELKVDINEADDAGQTALHLAVDSKDKQVVEAVMVLGASLEKRDISGQTAYERAISLNYPTADSFLGTSASCSGLKERKMALTRKILEHLRDTYVQTLAMRYSQTLDLVRASWSAENMESKLSDIWVSSMSIEALDWYATQILGPTTKNIYFSIISLFISTPAISCENVVKGEENMDAASEVATAILPHGTDSDMRKLAIRIQQNVAVSDLLWLRDCFRSPLGLRFTAGIKAKAPKEVNALTGFTMACGWLSI